MSEKLKNIKDQHVGQFLYQDRWVDKKTFRAWVYDKKGNQTLANSYKEFEDLTTSGIWFSRQPIVSETVQEELVVEIKKLEPKTLEPKTRKSKDVVCSNG